MARQNIFICDGKRINSIGDLYDSFNFEELKRCIAVGKLQFWLRANGHDVEAVAVEKLDLAAADADLQLLVALNAPEDKRNAFLARKREEEEAARLAAKQAEEEANAVKTAEQERADKHREVICQYKQYLADGKCNGEPVLLSIKPIIAKALNISVGRIENETKIKTLCADETVARRIGRVVGKEFGIDFTDADISKMIVVSDMVKCLTKRLAPISFKNSAPSCIAIIRRGKLGMAVRKTVGMKIGMTLCRIYGTLTEEVALIIGTETDKKRDVARIEQLEDLVIEKIHVTKRDMEEIFMQIEDDFVILFSDDEKSRIKTVGDITTLVEEKMLEDA